jgi:hypothetical protein
MAFGLMTKKWGILTRPLYIKMKHIKHVMVCFATLHNYCINERLMEASNQQSKRGGVPLVFTPHNVRLDAHAEHL